VVAVGKRSWRRLCIAAVAVGLCAAAWVGLQHLRGSLGVNAKLATSGAHRLCEMHRASESCPADRGPERLDPWGVPFWCLAASERRGLVFGTYGADGRPGGQHDDADIECAASSVSAGAVCSCNVRTGGSELDGQP
jgi:hypothetical protein